jgi:hypothetical protein
MNMVLGVPDRSAHEPNLATHEWPSNRLIEDAVATSETEMNAALAEVLNEMRRRWLASGEVLGAFTGTARHPDVLVTEPGVAPVVVETEVLPANSVEFDALGRLGETLTNGAVVTAAVAMRLPVRFRDSSRAQLRAELRAAKDLEYALLIGTHVHHSERFPSKGWLLGTVEDLAALIYDAAIPEPAIDAASTRLEVGVTAAATLLGQTIALHTDVAGAISGALRQQDGEQTRRMAMTIVANALVFHESLAGSFGVRTVDQLRNEMGALSKTTLLDEWRKILAVNYWPIFDIAQQIVIPLPQSDAAGILDILSRTSAALVAAGVTRSHDLSGRVFQRLVADRKFLATFYTRPQAAALLAALALPNSVLGNDPSKAGKFVVADFACGTGTLLAAAYRRIRLSHEHAGGDAEAIHAAMMEHALIGADVMPMSVHLAASMLASAYPNVRFTGTRLFTLPYGKQPSADYALGSLDLLKEHAQIQPLFRTSTPTRQTGTGQEEVQQRLEVGVGECDLVIMNPPFTRPTNHEGLHSNIPNPAFAAFGADPAEQKKMADLAKSLGRATCANGNAGVASYFVALADRMARATGTVAMVLPLTAAQGESWQKSRDLWRRGYRDLTIVSVAGAKSQDKSFSADTGMGEILIVARKKANQPPGQRGSFAVLKRRPRTTLEASEVARSLSAAASAASRRRLEDGPYGGTPIRIGDEVVGELLDCPLTEGSQWHVVGIADMSLAQTAYWLELGDLWLPQQPGKTVGKIPMTSLGRIAKLGFLHRDINGSGDRGAFDIVTPCPAAATYPTLWGHDATRERSLVVEPDSQALVRSGREPRAAEIWETRSHAHHNSDLRFNSQPLSMAFTEKPTLGGRSWPNLVLADPRREVALTLWGNTTLGLLCYWWHATKEQSGRGVMPRTQAATMPTLDVSQLDDEQLDNGARIFADMKHEQMLPFNEANHDDTRQLLDRRVTGEMLRLDISMLKPYLDLLRDKLCSEPSIHGGKKTSTMRS